MIKKFIPIFILFGLTAFFSSAFAVDYRNLGIEQRRYDIKKSQKKSDKSSAESDYTKEKSMIAQQLNIITGDEDTRYFIVPGDTLTISYQDRGERITNTYQVDSNGEIHMNLIDAVKVAQLNRQQARAQLEQLLSQFIRTPDVSVLINNTGSFMIVGAASPGVYELKPNLTMLEALLNAGYDADRANMHTVVVMRGGRDNPIMLKLNLAKMLKKGDRSDNIAVKPGDLIYVPNSPLYNFDKFKDKMFDYILDYYTLGGATLIKQKTTQSNQQTAE